MIIIDPGHGGTDPGAVSGDMKEKDYNLKISNYMYERFNDLGIPVYITRTIDETLSPTERINRITPKITSADDIVISNHLNAGGGDGAEIVYALRNNENLSRSILNNLEEQGQNIRKFYQRKLPSDPSKDYYFIIRNTSPAESILLEYAFIDSPKDDKNQIKNDYQNWAEAVVKAVADYKGYNYVPVGDNPVYDTYTVQKGDSLWSIAKRFNVSVDKLKEINNLTSNLISVGQKLTIPGVAPADQTNTTYIVQRGDSLWSIANANNTTVDEIVNLNDLVNTVISVGQALQIPNTGDGFEDTGSAVNKYIVQSGDNLYIIASKYNTTVNALKEANNLVSDNIVVGQVLTIPGDIESTGDNYIPDLNTYVVKKGDSLWSIANLYGVTVDDLMFANNLTSNVLTIGQIITIPDVNNNTESNIYVVQKGDSLWSIANKFGVSVNALRMINNLNSDFLSIGQSLIIP